jgi:uncharacterized membrane protein
MSQAGSISRFILAIFMIVAGTMHFVNPDFFLKIMPPYLPLHKELVLASGVCEVLLGVLLLIPKYSRPAAWGIMGLFIAVFPANVYLFSIRKSFRHHPSFICSGFRCRDCSFCGPIGIQNQPTRQRSQCKSLLHSGHVHRQM